MTDQPLRSLLITPELRRRLQQQYDEARRLAAQRKRDFRYIHDLLAECVQADPANILYLDALFANLRKREGAPEGWWQRLWRASRVICPNKEPRATSASTASDNSVLSTEYLILQETPEDLWLEPRQTNPLMRAAVAAAALDFDAVELRYLQAALELSPSDIEIHRSIARALTRQGRFEDAIPKWQAVFANSPDDSEAAQALSDLRSALSQDHNVPPQPTSDVTAILSSAKDFESAGNFAAAENLLSQAQAAAGGDLGILALREDLRIRQSEHRLSIARRRAVRDSHPKAQSLVARMDVEHNRLQIEILGARAERLPRDISVRIQLAQRLKEARNFSGAVQRLDEALDLSPNHPQALVELGECWQHLRQFAKAIDFYERAASPGPPQSTNETQKLAHYRAGVLAAALGNNAQAHAHFRAILAIDPGYKDARMRLDNLPPD